MFKPHTTSRRRVLYFSTRPCWPVTSGAHLRDFHLARQISLGHDLLYLAFDSTGSSGGAASHPQRLPELNDSRVVRVPRGKGYGATQLLRGALGSTPISVLNYTTSAMRGELQRILRAESFDFVQVEGVHLCAYLPLIRALAPQATIIMDWHNIESELMDRYADNTGSGPRRWYARRTARQLYNCEQRLLAESRAHTVCSEREQAQLLKRAPGAAVEVITNGVDVGFFAAAPDAEGSRRSIVFVGSMSYHANIDAACYFVEEIWPAIRERRPELEFRIVGSNPTAQVQALQQQPGVVVTGTVDDVRPYYREALAVVVPLRVGGGTRLKVLEAMASGTPVISTSLGAEGLQVTHDRDIVLANDAAAMVDAIMGMRAHDEHWQQLTVNGRKLVESTYDWSIIGKKLRGFYNLVDG
jgi:polysaccharide biosynthesis protein PslH